MQIFKINKDKKIIAFNITLILLAIINVVLYGYLINEYIKLWTLILYKPTKPTKQPKNYCELLQSNIIHENKRNLTWHTIIKGISYLYCYEKGESYDNTNTNYILVDTYYANLYNSNVGKRKWLKKINKPYR